MSEGSLDYQRALKLWGATRLGPDVDVDSVSVTFEFNKGYTCCGGTNPNCYCSYAESPRAYVEIQGLRSSERRRSSGEYEGVWATSTIDIKDFDFAAVLGEIVEAGEL